MHVEIVVAGSLGDLAAWAFADLVIESRQTIVVPDTATLAAVDYLAAHNVDVVGLRQRPAPTEQITGA